MIEFSSRYTHNYLAYEPKTKQRYKEICANVSEVMQSSVNSKIMLGDLLRELWESKSYAFRCEDAHKHDGKWYADKNAAPGVFFFVCESEFGLDRSEVSRLVNVAHEFSYMGKLKERWKDYKYSALSELLSLEPEEREEVKPDWTIRQIREYKKQLKSERIDFETLDQAICAGTDPDDETIDFEGLRDVSLSKLRSVDYSKCSSSDLVKVISEMFIRFDALWEYVAELEKKISEYEGPDSEDLQPELLYDDEAS